MPQARHFDGGLGGRLSTGSGGDVRPNQDRSRRHATDGDAQNPAHPRTLERFMNALMKGDRRASREVIRDALANGATASGVLEQLIWPSLSALDGWSRRDQISAVHEHCATILLRQIAQTLEDRLPTCFSRGRSMLVTSGQRPLEELAAQIFAGLAEAEGFDVTFLGGGVESDDAFAEIGRRIPDLVVSYAAAGTDAARLRRLLTALREQRPVPHLQVAVGGGVFTRAPGLADEFGIALQGDSPFDLLRALTDSGGAAGPNGNIGGALSARDLPGPMGSARAA